MVKGSKTQK